MECSRIAKGVQTHLDISDKKGMKGSNEAEVLTILETLCIFWPLFHSRVTIESDSSDAISWVSSSSVGPWRFCFHLVEIKFLSSLSQVAFKHLRGVLVGWWAP